MSLTDDVVGERCDQCGKVGYFDITNVIEVGIYTFFVCRGECESIARLDMEGFVENLRERGDIP